MKKLISCVLLLCICAVGCRRNVVTDDDVTFSVRADSALFICYANSAMGPDTFGVEKRYNICWPENLSDELQKEILRLAFVDREGNFEKVTEDFLDDLMLFDDDTLLQAVRVDDFDKNNWYSFEYVNVDCRRDKNLYCFQTSFENYYRFAAHGMYGSRYITFDADLNRIVRLNDFVDTSQLGPVIKRAIDDLVVNKDVRNSLFEEFVDAESMPVPTDFFIDSARTCIMLVYPLYEIAPYACGIQSVVLPIFWLSKHLELTPYAKEIFGKGSYLE